MDLNILVSLVTLISAWAGFSEWRIRSMYSQMKEKIEDKEKINQVIQRDLKEDILRLETKIDMLIKLNLKDSYNG